MNKIAYYPDSAELFTGEIKVTTPSKGLQNEVGGIRVEVASNPTSSLEIFTRSILPIRKEYSAYFTRANREPIQCNVDLELSEQPSIETVARAILHYSNVKTL